MALNQGQYEIDNCNIRDHEKRVIGFSCTFSGIFIKVLLVVLGQPVYSYTYKHNEKL